MRPACDRELVPLLRRNPPLQSMITNRESLCANSNGHETHRIPYFPTHLDQVAPPTSRRSEARRTYLSNREYAHTGTHPWSWVGNREILRLTTDVGEEAADYDYSHVKARSKVTSDHYIVITVAYDGHPGYGRFLEWVAPELRDAGLTMTEDHNNEPTPSRTWAGIVDGPTFDRFADAWHLEAQPHGPASDRMTQAGYPAARSYTFDGMNWETGGKSPIVYVSVLVDVPRHRYRQGADDSPRVRVHS
jgi:hypothetical protein